MSITPVRALAAGAAITTVALTATAFWLSYEHLHDVAASNGLEGSRAWAWPGTVDAFIVVGELLILRAALRGRKDWFAYMLAAVGSLGSIALNVLGVGAGASPMEYTVAAVPPVAALLAFAAVMRQVHDRLAGHAEEATTEIVAVPAATPAVVAVDTPAQVTLTRVAPTVPAIEAPTVEPLVICGDARVFNLTAPPAATEDRVPDVPAGRLPADAARIVLESAWAQGTTPTEAARLATRSTTYVKKVFARLDDERGQQPMAGQMALDTTGAVA